MKERSGQWSRCSATGTDADSAANEKIDDSSGAPMLFTVLTEVWMMTGDWASSAAATTARSDRSSTMLTAGTAYPASFAATTRSTVLAMLMSRPFAPALSIECATCNGQQATCIALYRQPRRCLAAHLRTTVRKSFGSRPNRAMNTPSGTAAGSACGIADPAERAGLRTAAVHHAGIADAAVEQPPHASVASATCPGGAGCGRPIAHAGS